MYLKILLQKFDFQFITWFLLILIVYVLIQILLLKWDGVRISDPSL